MMPAKIIPGEAPPVETPGKRKPLLIGALVLGLTGAGFAGFDLYGGARTAAALYSGEATGLSLFYSLDHVTQQSHTQFLNALGGTDPNRQQIFADRARAADGEVARMVKDLARLDPAPAVVRDGADLLGQWQSYLEARDAAIGLILNGSPEIAVTLATERGDSRYQAVSEAMGRMKRELERTDQQQKRTLRLTFQRAGAELLILFAGSFAVICVLLRLGAIVRRANRLIARAKDGEVSCNRILEMVGRNEPQEITLEALAHVVESRSVGGKAIISLLDGQQLRVQAAPAFLGGVEITDGLPDDLLTARFDPHSPATPDIEAMNVPETRFAGESDWMPHRAVVSSAGLKSCLWRPVCSSTGEVIGTVAVYWPTGEAPGAAEHENLASAAKLAGLAIEHWRLYRQLAQQALHDPLTALPNRTLFQDRLQYSIGLAQRDLRGIAVLWVDLDGFRSINESLGHRVGDTVLRGVAQRLTSCLRKSDTIARIGGDEFNIILRGVETQVSAEAVDRNIQQRLTRPIHVADQSVEITASIGISLYPAHGADPALLVRNADIAMYEAKRKGKNCFHTYDEQLGQSARERSDIRLQLATALENEEFDLHYQPQVSNGGAVTGFEALLRWTNPTLGKIGPDLFVPIAEETMEIVAIGEWVLRRACGQAVSWQRSGNHNLRMAVNVSSVQLFQEGFPDTVAAVLRETGLEPAHLCLELTETAVMNDITLAARQISALRALGVNVSIDDFGTGHSSLSYINRLSVNAVKVDQSFVRQIGEKSGASVSLIRTIVAMAHGMNMDVVAEGVETEAQLIALRLAGCDTTQGYLLHHPLTADRAGQLLRDQPPAVLAAIPAMPELALAG